MVGLFVSSMPGTKKGGKHGTSSVHSYGIAAGKIGSGNV